MGAIPVVETNRDRIVYILDDDVAVQESTTFLLATHDIAAQAFGSPHAFLAAFDPDRASCLLLDLHMPEMSGIDVLKQLRSRGVTTPVIVISGRSDASLDDLVKNLGAMAVLHKPPDNEELIGLLSRAIAKAGNS